MEQACDDFISQGDRNELETVMRALLKTSSAVMAGVMALGLVACGPSDGPELLADNETSMKAKEATEQAEAQKVSVQKAENRAAAAEARAREAEARIACEKARQEASNRGAVVGGITGAVIGSQVAGDGAKSEGGAIGGVAGVLAGRQIAKKDHRC
jgi:uncharacterized protein YcfJ